MTAESDKATGYDSKYIDSSDLGSYEDTSEGSSADDARRHRPRKNNYDPNVPFKDFFIGLQFENMKLFNGELVEFSTRKRFEFSYIKNDLVRVRAKCSPKGCKWLILCSWCSVKKVYVVKHYVADHSSILGATKNRRVTAYVVAKRFEEVIGGMPSIKPRHVKAMVRKEMGVFITNKVYKNAKALVLKKIKVCMPCIN